MTNETSTLKTQLNKAFAVLIPTTGGRPDTPPPGALPGTLVEPVDADGEISVQDAECPWRSARWSVKRYAFDAKNASEKFVALAYMLKLAGPQSPDYPVDYHLIARKIRELTKATVGERYEAAFARQLEADPEGWMKWDLPALFNNAVLKTRFVIWWPNNGSLQPAVYCEDRETASMVFLLQGRVRACVEDKCRTLFVPNRSKQMYCSLRCNNRARQRRKRGN
ncbi:MAG: hypothetical protein ABSC64_22180 [Candidatus Korobacteraceae bacterium]